MDVMEVVRDHRDELPLTERWGFGGEQHEGSFRRCQGLLCLETSSLREVALHGDGTETHAMCMKRGEAVWDVGSRERGKEMQVQTQEGEHVPQPQELSGSWGYQKPKHNPFCALRGKGLFCFLNCTFKVHGD